MNGITAEKNKHTPPDRNTGDAGEEVCVQEGGYMFVKSKEAPINQ